MRTCHEVTKDEKERDVCCMLEVVPGLDHCREHALERLALDRAREANVLERIKDRAALLVERELELDELTADQARDRECYLSTRQRLLRYLDAIAQSSVP